MPLCLVLLMFSCTSYCLPQHLDTNELQPDININSKIKQYTCNSKQYVDFCNLKHESINKKNIINCKFFDQKDQFHTCSLTKAHIHCQKCLKKVHIFS